MSTEVMALVVSVFAFLLSVVSLYWQAVQQQHISHIDVIGRRREIILALMNHGVILQDTAARLESSLDKAPIEYRGRIKAQQALVLDFVKRVDKMVLTLEAADFSQVRRLRRVRVGIEDMYSGAVVLLEHAKIVTNSVERMVEFLEAGKKLQT
jgi:hypothetical protein